MSTIAGGAFGSACSIAGGPHREARALLWLGRPKVLHDLELDLLDFGEPFPLPGHEVIDLLVQVPDLRARP